MLLPNSVERIDAQWLSAALSDRFPGIQVESTTIASKYRGTATVLKLAVDYSPQNAAVNAPPSLYLKAGFEAEHESLWKMGIYQREAFFYAHARPDLCGRPECFFSHCDDGQRQFTILLEDLALRGARYGSALRPLDPDHLESGLMRLSEIHAEPIGHWDGIGGRLPLSMEGNRATFVSHVESADKLFASLRGHAIPFSLRDPAKLAAAFPIYEKLLRSQPRVLLHGDPHPGNIYYTREDAVCFLDYQGLCSGPWMQDVAYFLIGSLDVVERRYHERDMLKSYCEQLKRRTGIKPDFEDVWTQYRLAAFYGFLVWLGNQDNWQLPEINLVGLVRFAAAMVDHDSYHLLGL